MSSDLSPIFPSKFEAVFPRRICGSAPHLFSWPGTAGYISSVNLSSITFSDASVNPAPQGVSDTTLTLRDTAQARFNAPAAAPTNQTALDALARQLFQDWCDWRSQSFDIVYNGIVDPLPNGLIDVAEFCYTAEDQWTRVQSAAWSGDPVEYQHFDPTISDSACQQSWDRGPGTLFLGPGASGTSGSTTLVRDVLSLEDGRLVEVYDSKETVNCGCAPPPPSCPLCVSITGCSQLGTAGNTVTISTATVTAVNLISGGLNYTSPPNVIFATGSGAGATAVPVMQTFSVLFIVSGGTGYTVGDVLTVVGGTFTAQATLNVTSTGAGGVITGLSLGAKGSYSPSPPNPVSFTGGTGNGASVNLRWNIKAITVTNGGAYFAAPGVTISGGGGSGASATAVISALSPVGTCTTQNQVASVTMVSSGSGYTSAPTVSFTGGGGSGAAGTANLNTVTHTITSVTVTNGGSGYTSAPAVGFSGGGGSGAQANAVLGSKCCVNAPTSGGYQASSTACTNTANIVIACPTGGNVTLTSTQSLTISVHGCGGDNFRWGFGMTYTLDGPGGYHVGPFVFVPGSTGLVSFCVPADGTYTLAINGGPCYQNFSTSITVSSCTQTFGPYQLTSKTYTATINVRGCGCTLATSYLQNASVTLTGPGYSQTQTSDSNGNCTFTNVAGLCDYTATATYPRFQTITASFPNAACADWTGSMTFSTPISGYRCVADVPYPIPETLFATDSAGTVTLTYGNNFRVGNLYGGAHLANTQTCVCESGPCLGEVVSVGPPVVYKTFQGIPAIEYDVGPCAGANNWVGGIFTSAVEGGTLIAAGQVVIIGTSPIPAVINPAGSPCAEQPTVDPTCSPQAAIITVAIPPPLIPPFSITLSVTGGACPGTVVISE